MESNTKARIAFFTLGDRVFLGGRGAPVRMAFATYAGTVQIGVSDEVVFEGDGRPADVILRWRSVTLPRPGSSSSCSRTGIG